MWKICDNIQKKSMNQLTP